MGEVKHILDRDGDKLTDVHYLADGVPAYSRLAGHLSAIEAIIAIERMRARAKQVVYVQH